MPELIFTNHQKLAYEYKIEDDESCLHEKIIESLFRYKENICKVFNDINGTFFLDHFSITIFDSTNTMVIFSNTPSVEYNLISNGLWKFDHAFSSEFHRHNRFYTWEKAYSSDHVQELTLHKQTNHKFSFGFNLSKTIDSRIIVYSFGTRSLEVGFNYYRNYTNELFCIGDYIYKSIKEIYQLKFSETTDQHQKISHKKFNTYLRLID